MKVAIAIGSFKGSPSSVAAGNAVAEGGENGAKTFVIGNGGSATPEMVATPDAALANFASVFRVFGVSRVFSVSRVFRAFRGSRGSRVFRGFRDFSDSGVSRASIDPNDLSGRPDAGAAGGLGFAFKTFLGADRRCAAGVDAYFQILRKLVSLEEALDVKNAAANLAAAVEQAFRLISVTTAPSPSPHPCSTSASDGEGAVVTTS